LGNLDVLRLVPYEVLTDPTSPFGTYLEESNNRLGALQSRALERLIAYMREKGSRICDHAAARDDCLLAWRLPPEVPPRPPAHPNIESFFVYEVEKGDPLQRHFVADQHAALSAADLQVLGAQSRLRTTSDWIVFEASSDTPPCLVLGADGDGQRGAVCVFEPLVNSWRLIRGMRLPAATLLLAEIVFERVRCGEAREGDRLFTAEWSTPGYTPGRCEGADCGTRLARGLLQARDNGETAQVKLELQRGESGVEATERVRTSCAVVP
jgi:hypothetical protein